MELDEQEQEAREWLRSRGWNLRVEVRDLREDFVRRGEKYAWSFDHTHWADLVSIENPDFVVSNYGSGMSQAEAAVRAKQRWGQEQT